MKNSARVILIVMLLLIATAGLARGKGKESDEDNPHEKMTRSKSACLDCHTKLPKAGEHAADYFLVDTPSEHCLGCHDENEHPGTHEHLGKDMTVPLPGDEHGKIACFTCHDPHPNGVLEGRTVHAVDINEATAAFIAARQLPAGVERRETKPQFGALLRLPMTNGDGCWKCHAVHDEDESWRTRLLPNQFIRVLPR
jgi:hypothetical protein